MLSPMYTYAITVSVCVVCLCVCVRECVCEWVRVCVCVCVCVSDCLFGYPAQVHLHAPSLCWLDLLEFGTQVDLCFQSWPRVSSNPPTLTKTQRHIHTTMPIAFSQSTWNKVYTVFIIWQLTNYIMLSLMPFVYYSIWWISQHKSLYIKLFWRIALPH